MRRVVIANNDEGKITEASCKEFLKHFISTCDKPYLVKAAKKIKAVKIGADPSMNLKSVGVIGAQMSINLKTMTMYFSTHSQWGEWKLDERALCHELGHLMYQSIVGKPQALAFKAAVLEELAKGKDICDYQSRVYDRYKKKIVGADLVAHESFAEWVKFGDSQSRGCPKQYEAFKACLKILS